MPWKQIIKYCAQHWFTVVPAFVLLWPSVVTAAIYWDVVVNIVTLAATEDPETGLTGLQKYLQMYSQHQVLWCERNGDC